MKIILSSVKPVRCGSRLILIAAIGRSVCLHISHKGVEV